MTATVAIVGGALRGTSMLERIGDAVGRYGGPAVHTVVIDPHPPGPGAVWRTDQSPLLLMNTPAAASTLWPDDADRGLSFWQWLNSEAVDPALRASADGATPQSFLPRALHGHYLRWAYRRIVADLPAAVSHEWRRDEVVDMQRSGAGFTLSLASGATPVRAEAVVLATGWSDDVRPVRPDGRARCIDAGSPIRQDLDAIAPGEHVLAVGMGLNFFDAVTLLTAGRGGTFDEDDSGELVYRPSGAEPVIVATSRRGFPYRSRLRGAEAPHTSLKCFVRSGDSRPIDFTAELLPRIVHDANAEYYRALAEQRPDTVTVGAGDFIDAFTRWAPGAEAFDAFLEHAVPQRINRFDARSLLEPVAAMWTTPARFRSAVLAALRRDIEAAVAEVECPERVATRSFCEARRVLVPIIRYGALRTLDDYQRYADEVSFLSNGPPVRRLRELVALLEAGVVDVLGPMPVESIRHGGLVVSSAQVADSARPFTVRLEARVPKPSVHGGDRLTSALRRSGLVRAWRETSDAVDTDRDTGAVLGPDGAVVPGLYAAGLLTWDYRLHSLMAPVPGSDSPFFHETTCIADSLVAHLRSADVRPDESPTKG